MTGVICLIGGLVIGAFAGVVLMSILQINRINMYEEKIKKLERQLEEIKQCR